MAVTAIWRVKGWLGKVMLYVENPEKTDNPEAALKMEMTDSKAMGLSDVIAYAAREEKTGSIRMDDEGEEIMQQFVSGINCYPGTAREEMLAVKKRFGKEDGTVAYHGYQSFAPGEATPETVHEIGVKLAEQLWGEKYQVLVATHLDKANHLHNHFVLNTVSFVDGIKYHRTEKDYYEMQQVSDALCRACGLSVIESPQRGKARHYGEWRAEQENRPTWRGLVQKDVDEAVSRSMTERQFFDILRKKGYEIKTGKDISVRPPGKERFVRLMRNFGEDYGLEGIRSRILSHTWPEGLLPEPGRKTQRMYYHGNPKTARKITGFRALYFHYCYLLGIFSKDRQRGSHGQHFLLREDLIKLKAISEETKLLARHRIDTAGQLSSYRKDLAARIEALSDERRKLYKIQRSAAVQSDHDRKTDVKTQIAALSKDLSVLRREVKLCDEIELRSGIIREKIVAVQKCKNRGKEEKCYEHIR